MPIASSTSLLPAIPWWAFRRRVRRWRDTRRALIAATQGAHRRIDDLIEKQVEHRLWLESLIECSDCRKRLFRVHSDKVAAVNAALKAFREGQGDASVPSADVAPEPEAASAA